MFDFICTHWANGVAQAYMDVNGITFSVAFMPFTGDSENVSRITSFIIWETVTYSETITYNEA